jgi:hypothetical protein
MMAVLKQPGATLQMVTPERLEFVGHRRRQRIERVFAGGVHRHVRNRHEGGTGRYIHDPSGSPRTHVRQHRLHHAQRAEHVGIEDRAGLFDAGHLGRRDQVQASVVDHNVDTAKTFDDVGDCRLHRSFIAYINGDGLELEAFRDGGLGQCGGFTHVAATSRDRSAGAGQRQSGRFRQNLMNSR